MPKINTLTSVLNEVKIPQKYQMHRRPFHRGASAKLLMDGNTFLPIMYRAIKEAKRQILLECYMIASDDTGRSFVDLLCQKAEEGVSVWAVFDAVGSRDLSKADRQRLKRSNVHLVMFHPLRFFSLFETFWRTHRRILVVDGLLGFVGGYGFTDEWIKERGISPFHELVWQLEGSIINDLITCFRLGLNPIYRRGVEKIYTPSASENLPYRIINLTYKRREALTRLMIRGSKTVAQRLWIATGYFIPSFFLRHALKKAARRGVDVRLMLTGIKTDHPAVYYAGRRYYHELLKAGISIFETKERMMHAKALILDDDYSTLGSANLDSWSLRYNRELNVEIFDRQVNADLEQAMLHIQSLSRRISLENWTDRPVWKRFLEYFFGVADDWL